MSDHAKLFVESEPASPARRSWLELLVLLMGFSFFSWFNRTTMAVAGTDKLIPDHGLSEEQMGVVYFIFLLPYALCMTPGGWLVDRIGPRGGLILMGFGSALFVVLTGVVGQVLAFGMALFGGLLVVRFVMGTFTAPLYPAAARVVGLEMPVQRQALANGLVTGAASVGNACAPFVFGALMDLYGWPLAFITAGVATAALTAWWLFRTAHMPSLGSAHRQKLQALVEPARQADDRASRKVLAPRDYPWWRLLQNRSLVLLTIAYGALGYYEYLFFFWSQYYFKDVLHFEKWQSRSYSAILMLSAALGMFLGGWVADRVARSFGLWAGRVLVPIIGFVSASGFLGLGLLVASRVGERPWTPAEICALVGCLSLAMAGIGSIEGPLWALAVALGGRRGGTAGGILNTGGNLGGMPAPYVTPFLAARFGWTFAVAVAGVVCAIGVATLCFVDPRERLPEEMDA